MAEAEIRGDEEPRLEAAFEQRLGGACRKSVRVVGDMHGHGGALAGGELRRRGFRGEDDVAGLLAEARDSKRRWCVGQVRDDIHALDIKPAAGDLRCEVGLVQEVRLDDIHRQAGGFRGMILNRHAGCEHRAGPADFHGIAREITHHSDADTALVGACRQIGRKAAGGSASR